MENSSKALIIAGAILIAILLISVGIIVMNSVNKPLGEVSNESDSQAVQMFNSKFTQFAGNNKNVNDVKQLIKIINSTMGTNNEVILFAQQKISDEKGNDNSIHSFTASVLASHLSNNKTYKISMGGKNSNDPPYTISDTSKYKATWDNKKIGTGYIAWVCIEED